MIRNPRCDFWRTTRKFVSGVGVCYFGSMALADRITIDLNVLVGKPVVRGTRLSVELIVDLLAQGWTQEQILDSYPNLTVDDIRACLAYASELLHAERVYRLKSG